VWAEPTVFYAQRAFWEVWNLFAIEKGSKKLKIFRLYDISFDKNSTTF